MKGLLIKDLRLILKNKKLIILIFFPIVMLGTLETEEAASFLVSFTTTICGTLVLNTISIDEYDKSVAFLMTMPISKGLYAVEKYVFALGSGFLGCILSVIFCIIGIKSSILIIIEQALLIFLVLSVFQMIILPIQLKFGSDIGRIILLGIIAFFILVTQIVTRIEKETLFLQISEKWEKIIQGNSSGKWFFYLIVGIVWLGCLFISITISKIIMKKKEY